MFYSARLELRGKAMKPLDAALPILKYSLKIVITAIREMSAIKLFDTLIYA